MDTMRRDVDRRLLALLNVLVWTNTVSLTLSLADVSRRMVVGK